MKIGFIGLGKLGYPCAVALKAQGHSVMGYDVKEELNSNDRSLLNEADPSGKPRFNEWRTQVGGPAFGDIENICEWSDLIMVAVQTPHEPEYDGTHILPSLRKDFDYSLLKEVLTELSLRIEHPTPILVISTVLPRTYQERLAPILSKNPNLLYVYNPFFIAMGTVVPDFLNPEFVLLGSNNPSALRTTRELYQTFISAPILSLSIEEAELVKVLYNTYITQKITFANTALEIADKTPNCNVEKVLNTLKLGHRRITSTAYLSPGMGDGGACHPRDNIALSHFSQRNGLSFNYFETLMQARQSQAEWLADLMENESPLPKAILGVSYKANSPLVDGSHALLVKRILELRGHEVQVYDPIAGIYGALTRPHIFLLGAAHDVFKRLNLPSGSVLLDPWRFMVEHQEDVTYIQLGARSQ